MCLVKNKRGQALIEFVLILPLFLLLLFAAIDFGKIINAKNVLENKINDVRIMLKEEKTNEEIKTFINIDKQYKIEISINEEADYTHINLSTNLNLITPGLNRVLSNPHPVKVNRVIKNG